MAEQVDNAVTGPRRTACRPELETKAKVLPIPLPQPQRASACISLTFGKKMLAASISRQVQPYLDRLKREVESQQRFQISNIGVGEDGDKIGFIGIRCEEEPTLRLPALSFGVVVTRFGDSGPRKAVASVAWSVPWMRDKQDGLAAYEGRFGPVVMENDLLPESVLRRLAVYERRFSRALRRGRPPGKLLAFWRALIEGVPMPQVIRLTESKKQTTNQALEPTSTAVTPPAVAGDRASGTRGSP